MSIIKTFHTNGSHGDMFYIIHGSSNFSIIDCCLCDENKEVSSVPGRIVTFSTKSGILGHWKRDLAI